MVILECNNYYWHVLFSIDSLLETSTEKYKQMRREMINWGKLWKEITNQQTVYEHVLATHVHK